MPAAAGIAVSAIAAAPAHSCSLASRPSGDSGSDLIDDPDDLMSRDARVSDSRVESLFSHRIAVADSAGLDFDSYRSGPGLWDITFDDFKVSPGARDLHGAHLRHNPPA
jgi:hypothetical protein